jgi:hypothetical protein
VRACEFVGGRADIHAGVVQHKVFEVDGLVSERQGGGSVGKMGACDPAVAERAFAEAFIEARQGIRGRGERFCKVATGQRIWPAIGDEQGIDESGIQSRCRS